MTKNRKYIVPGFDKILNYIHKRISNKERHSFEKEIQQDPFLEDAVEGLSMVSEEKARQDIKSVNELIKQKSSGKTIFPYRAVAAAAALLLVTGLSYLAIDRYRGSFEEEQIGREEAVMPDEVDAIKELSIFDKEDLIPDVPDVEPKAAKQEIQRKARPAQEVATIVSEDIEFDVEYSIDAERAEDARPTITIEAQAESPRLEIMPFVEESAPGETYKTITGKVLDAADGSPIPGASVIIEGTTQGVVTDLDGNFSIDISIEEDVTLLASFVGMETAEYSPEKREDNIIALESSTVGLSEVVVVGYGTRRSVFVKGVERVMDAYMDDSDDLPPRPEIGFEEYEEYLNENAVLPPDYHRRRFVVIVDFYVKANGQLENFSILRSPDEEYSLKAIEIIKNGPAWIPAKAAGSYRTEMVRVKIVFRR